MKMNYRKIVRSSALVVVLTGVSYGFVPTETGFSFQGQLKQGGIPTNDTCDFMFTLWRDPLDANPVLRVDPTLVFDGLGGNPGPVEVVNGVFQVVLDFGADALANDPLWLEILVSCPAGTGVFTGLSPRQPVAAAPFSVQTRGLHVDDNGNVGVGTNSPTEHLHVNGNLALRTEGFDAHIELTSDDAANGTTVFLKSLDGVGFEVTDDSDAPYLVVQTRTGNVGIGTSSPTTLLHVEGKGGLYGNHVAFIDSQGGDSPDGLAIRLGNAHTNRDNNFVTFLNARDGVAGRIEGFDFENGDWITPPPLPRVGLSFDPGIEYNRDWLDLGLLPNVTFDPGRLPTVILNPGELPTVSFNRGGLPTATLNRGSLPSLNFTGGSLPSLVFSRGSLPTASFNDGSLPSLSRGSLPSLSIRFSFPPSFNFNRGSLPSLTAGSLPSLSFTRGSLPTATFSRGSLPTATFSRGALPSLTFGGGGLPSLTFDDGELPSITLVDGALPVLSFTDGRLPAILKSPLIFNGPSLILDLPTAAEIEALFCWSIENGVADFLTMDPVSLAVASLKEAAACACKDEGVTYGSKGADYAEWLEKMNPGDRFQFGQIIGVHDGKVSLKTEGAEQIMAVSRQPVVVGNVPPKEEEYKYVTVGFMGQLPVVVRGKVTAGDYVIASGLEDGTGIAITPENLQIKHLGRIVGRAWSESENDIYSLITVTIGLDNNETKVILERQQEQIETQARGQLTLTSENARLKTQLASMNVKLAEVLASVEQLEDSMNGKASCRLTSARVGDGR